MFIDAGLNVAWVRCSLKSTGCFTTRAKQNNGTF